MKILIQTQEIITAVHVNFKTNLFISEYYVIM